MLGDLLLKKAIEQSLDGMTPEEQDELVTMVEQHPDLFKKMSQEYKDKIDAGQSQLDAATEVITSHGLELREIQA